MIVLRLLPKLMKRNGLRFLLAFLSLAVGALTLATVLGLIGSVQQFFVTESQSLVGGDITIEENSPTAIEGTPTLTQLTTLGATYSRRIDTLVVVQSNKKPDAGRLSSLLVSLKVVDQNYPLFGTLGTEDRVIVPLAKNQVLVVRDLLVRMGLSKGDTLTIGKGTFVIADVITSEPDRVAGSFRLGPLLIMSDVGWSMTGIFGTQSRADYTLSVRYPDTLAKNLATVYSAQLRKEFTRLGSQVTVASDGPATLNRILDAAKRFFFTIIVLTLFLVIVNIRVNLIYFLASFQKTIAIMHALGLRRFHLLLLFLLMLGMLSLIAGVVGALAGNLLASIILPYAQSFIGSTLPTVPVVANIPLISLFTLLLCLFSATGFLSRVIAIDPKMLLMGYGVEHGNFRTLLREIPALMLTLIGLYLVVWYLTSSAFIGFIAVASIAGVFMVLFFLVRVGIALGHRKRFAFSFPVRSIMNFLRHQGVLGVTAITSLTIALASIFAVALIEQNVRGNLGTEFKHDAPNLYAIDIQSDQLPGVREIMGNSWKDFSVVRGRFMKRDGYSIQDNIATEDGELAREFNLTSRGELIDGERVFSGRWHGESGIHQVSVEREFAQRAKLTLGSNVEFQVAGIPISATVTSLHEVSATGGLPFFFLVFSPDVLRDFPRSSFGYAFVPETNIPDIQNRLARAYPNISTIPTTQILETVNKVVGVLTIAVIATAIPALILGFILIIAMLALAVRERSNDMLVFTAFGARLRLLFSLFVLESVAVITLAGLFAILISFLGAYLLNRYLFAFKGFYGSWDILWIMIAVVILTSVIALWFAKRFTSLTPTELLRKN